jgi:hypothetical protein
MSVRDNSKFLDPVNGREVPKVDNAIAVGEDLAFQERWWTFERVVWSFFVLVLIADVLGLFGAGWLAHVQINEPATAMRVHYDRVVRTGTPSTLSIQFEPDAAADGKVELIVSDSMIKKFGAQRVIPQPQTSAIAAGNMIYTFPAGEKPGEVDFDLQPSSPGLYYFTLQVPGHAAITRRVVVVP